LNFSCAIHRLDVIQALDSHCKNKRSEGGDAWRYVNMVNGRRATANNGGDKAGRRRPPAASRWQARRRTAAGGGWRLAVGDAWRSSWVGAASNRHSASLRLFHITSKNMAK